jgi:hypothetical protein
MSGMDEPHMLHTPQEPNPSDAMEALLIDEITQLVATLGVDPLSPTKTLSLRAASVETLGRQADRHERLALLYRQLAIRRGRGLYGEAMP